MDRLHTVLRSIKGEAKPERSHLDVFREFLTHLEKVNRKAAGKTPPRAKPPKRKTIKRGKA